MTSKIFSREPMTMPIDNELDAIDWSLTTWQGARREQMRRWAELPLENIVAALEEMQTLAEQLGPPERKGRTDENRS
jgi:hypothetical protein